MAGGNAPATQSHGEHGEHGEVEHHGHGAPAPVVVNGVSSDDEPSVEWGWHGHYPKVAHFAGFAVGAIMLIMLWGNHEGRQEEIWLVVMALGFFALSGLAVARSKRSWR